MLIIPAIDLIGGRTVRLSEGDYDRKTDYDLDPIATAQSFEAQGAEWLHVVDLEGAKSGSPMNLNVVQRIANETSLKIEFGGGLRDFDSMDAAFQAGVHRVVLGSKLAKDSIFAAKVLEKFGDRVIAGIDTRSGMVSIEGWREAGAVTGVDLAKQLVALGCARIITTDIARDGMLIGPNLPWFEAMTSAVSVPIIASGGITELSDITDLAKIPGRGVEAVIVGKALYEGRFTLSAAIAL